MEIPVMTDVLAKNDAIAANLHELFRKKKILVLNILGSPGAGKTSLLEATLRDLAKDVSIAVIEGDLFTEKDAKRIHDIGIPVVQINTAGGCHLDAAMVDRAISTLDVDNLDLLIIENVGNLVCPAEFNIGEDKKVVVLSVTEGEDKPLKYPLVFKESSAVLLNKVDLLPYIPFDKAAAIEDISCLNPTAPIFEVSCVEKNGLDPWLSWVREEVRKRKEEGQ